MTQNYHYPNISQSVWILVLLSVLMGVLSIPFALLADDDSSQLSQHPAVGSLISVVAFGLILMRGLKRAKASLREICPLVPVRLSLLFPMALAVIGTSILISETDNLLRTFLPPPAWFDELFRSLLSGEISLWGSILSLVVVAPLTEELLVRGLILRGFLSHYSTRKAILASAIFFGVLHLNPWQLIGATALGILFAWWFVETRSMLPCLFGHALANALPLTVMALIPLEIPGYTSGFEQGTFQPLWFDFAGVVLVLLGIWLLVHQFRKSGDTVSEDVSGDRSDQL